MRLQHRGRFLLAISLLLACTVRSATLPSNFSEQTIGSSWTDINGITFAVDGRAIVWERIGRLWLLENDTKPSQPLLDIGEEVGAWRDHGLLSVALHPDFLNNGWIYLLYVVDHHHLVRFGTSSYDPSANEYTRATIGRITRYTARASDNFRTIDPASRLVILGESLSNGFPVVFTSHGMGSLVFGEDGTLLVSCGDGASSTSTDIGSASETYYSQAISEGIMPAKHNVGTFRAQMLSSLNGKILRIDPATGDGIPGNPFYDANNPRAPQSRIWALGLRNPFRFALRPGSGTHDRSAAQPGALYIGDVGWTTRDELNVCTAPGQNFGWPIFEGFEGQSKYSSPNIANQDALNPLYPASGCSQQFFLFRDLVKQASLGSVSWPNPCDPARQIDNVPVFVQTRPAFDWWSGARVGVFNGTNAAVVSLGSSSSPVAGQSFDGSCSIGGVWYTGNDFPTIYQNSYFHGDYVGGWIKNFVFDQQNRPSEVRNFASSAGSVVCIATHPLNGGLYYVSWPSTLRRVRYVPSGNRPPIARGGFDRNYGPGPIEVQFNGSASEDPEGFALTYRWSFGDGSAADTNANPVHTFDAPAGVPTRYDVILTVTDRSGAPNSAPLVVSVNNSPPVVTILSPTNGAPYTRGTTTVYQCSAEITDAEQDATQLSCVWQTILHHNTHMHPEPPDTNCTTTTVLSPAECDGQTYFYRVVLTVTDAAGLSGTNQVILIPNCDLVVPSITWTNPADIPYGTRLGSDQLNATANVAGQFTYSPSAGTALNAGTNQELTVFFQPADRTSYASTTARAAITVLPASLEIRARDQTKPYGSPVPPLSATYAGFINNDGPANLDSPVTLSTPVNADSPVGTYPIYAGGAADVNYVINHLDGVMTVGPGIPVITWTNPLPIVLGTPLNETQLNASANVLGAFIYDPPGGAVLGAGSQRLSLVFTADDTNYLPVTTSVTVDIIAPPSAPTGLRATAALLTWNDTFVDEAGFKVERSTNGIDFTDAAIFGPNATNGVVSSIRGATNYYRARAFNIAGYSDYSEVATVFLPLVIGPVSTLLIPSNSVWKYLDNGSNQGTAWIASNFEDSSWRSGPAEFGYNNSPQATIVSYGPDSDHRYMTTYFRKPFYVEDATLYTNLFFQVLRDDGVVVYLNGREIFRSNMPLGPITYTTEADDSVGSSDEKVFFPTNVSPRYLLTGTNVLAVELHNSSSSSSDLGFNLQLTGTGFVPEPPDPTRVIDLVAASSTSNSITLAWTAPNPAGWGALMPYDLRLSPLALTESNWLDAVQVAQTPIPSAPGTMESLSIASLARGSTYYFALRILDDLGNVSRISNVATGATDGLPDPWSNADIGAVGVPGSARHANGLFTVRASGTDISSSRDAFHFVFLPASGDCEIRARVTNLVNTSSSAKAGVMIRETLSDNSRYAMMVYLAGKKIQFQRRSSTGGSTSSGSSSSATAPYWLRLVRAGNTFTAYRSPNGTSWSRVTSTSISMTNNLYIGLAVTSRNNTVLTTGTFDNVTVTP